MNDASGLIGGHGHQLEHPSVSVEHEQAVFAVVVVLDEPHGLGPSVLNVRVIDPVLSGRLPDLHLSAALPPALEVTGRADER